MKTVSKVERFENAMISLSGRQIIFTENANFENDATTTTNYSNYLDTQTIDLRWFLTFSIVFAKTAENDMITIRK